MSNEIVKTGEIEDFQEFVKTLSEEPITVKNCKLCNSKHRKEAEEMADRGQSSMAVFRWLETHGEDIKYGAVNHHINEHFKPSQTNQNLKSLATRVGQWSRLSHSDEAILKRIIKSLDMEYNYLQSQNAGLVLTEQRRNIELMLKIAQVIDTYRDQLHKLQEDMRPVEIFYSSLHRIVEIKLKSITNPETKRLLFEIMNEMDRAVGDVSTDGAKLVE